MTRPVGRTALLSRFSAPARRLRFWVATWSLVVVPEFVALIPVLFSNGPVVASDVVSRLLGGSFTASRSTVPTAVECGLSERLPRPIELALYLVACEAPASGGADEASGSGLRGLADRVETLGGRLRVTSPPGEGTVVTAELPVASGA